MKLTYFGTAAAEGWPGLFCRCEHCQKARALGGKNLRTRSQALVDDRLLIDYPADTYWHMMVLGLNLPELTDCLITHAHEDHLYVDDLKVRGASYANCVVPGDFTVYGNDEVVRRLNAVPPDEIGRVAWRELTEFESYDIAGYQVVALLARHNPREKCFIYRVERNGKALLYGNDTGIFPEETWAYIAGKRFDLVSLDCTMLKIPEGTNHMGIADVLKVKERMLGEGCADARTLFVVTHFSHNGGLLHDELADTLAPHGILVAYDGMSVEC